MVRKRIFNWLAITTGIVSTVFMVITGCNQEGCGDCGGGLIDGYLYQRVTSDDLLLLQSAFPDLQLDECIRFQMDDLQEIDPQSVEFVPDCCCDLYE